QESARSLFVFVKIAASSLGLFSLFLAEPEVRDEAPSILFVSQDRSQEAPRWLSDYAFRDLGEIPSFREPASIHGALCRDLTRHVFDRTVVRGCHYDFVPREALADRANRPEILSGLPPAYDCTECLVGRPELCERLGAAHDDGGNYVSKKSGLSGAWRTVDSDQSSSTCKL